MTDDETGLLAIWSTIAPEVETDYLHWLTREHLFERVSVAGFQSGRVFRRHDSRPSEYLMLYELDNAQVVSSPAYLERLNDPTPWTRRVMPLLAQFRRGGGTLSAQGGYRVGQVRGHGARLAVARFDHTLPDTLNGSRGQHVADALAQLDWVANAQILLVKNEATSIATQEKAIRTGAEGAFVGLLIVESFDAASLDRAIVRASELGGIEPGVFEAYDLVFTCNR